MKFGDFRGGVYPPSSKNAMDSSTENMGIPSKVLIPMVQHVGCPCEPLVKKGDYVKLGQVIGETSIYVSAPIHSSVSGTVVSVDERIISQSKPVVCIEIKPDGLQEISEEVKPPLIDSKESFLDAIKKSGLTGLGGAGFPAHVKLNPPQDAQIDILIINAAECEPYITSDYRECMEKADSIIDGIKLVLKWTGIPRAQIGVEDNKPKAIKKLKELVKPYENITVHSLKSRYPQGAEKMLIKSLTGREIPYGKLPHNVGCLMMNVASVSFVAEYAKTGVPLIKRRITVDGNIVKTPKNVEVLLGTPLQEVFEYCDGFTKDAAKILMGGPMMGLAMYSTELPVMKYTNSLLAFDETEGSLPPEEPCIRCARCVNVCPVNLLPFDIDRLVKANKMDSIEDYNVMDCIECGACAYICPAKRLLLQSIRLAKDFSKRMAIKLSMDYECDN